MARPPPSGCKYAGGSAPFRFIRNAVQSKNYSFLLFTMLILRLLLSLFSLELAVTMETVTCQNKCINVNALNGVEKNYQVFFLMIK